MRKKISLIICIALSILITYLFAKDRWIGYDKIPDNKVFDERNYALQGMSLRTNGIPIGWSDLGIYNSIPPEAKDIKMQDLSVLVNSTKPSTSNFRNFPKPVISVNQYDFGYGTQHIRFVQPFLDHPPLGGLTYSLGVDKDVHNFLDIKPDEYRKPALYLAVATSILLFIFVLQISGNPFIALLSIAVYNFVPTYLLATRYALLENMVAPMSLLSLNLLIPGIKAGKGKKSFILLFLSGIVAGLAILAKESAVGFLLGSIILLLFYKAPKSKIIQFIGGSILPLIAYFAWGFWFFQDFFIKVILSNTQRGFMGSLNFIKIFSDLGLKNFSMDGWWIFGFISIIFLFFEDKKKLAPILIPFAAELFVILFLSCINYPWYYFSLIPFLSAAAGYTLWMVITKPNAILLSVFFLFPFSSSFYWGYSVLHGNPSNLIYRLILATFAATAAARLILTKNKIVKLAWILFSILLILLLIKFNHHAILYIIANWEKKIIPVFPEI